jgi:hypothetical protein
MVSSNGILYEPGEHPDHVVVIKVIDLTFVTLSTPFPILTLEVLYLFFFLFFFNFCFVFYLYSMCHMLEIARELWMSTPRRYSWVGKTL